MTKKTRERLSTILRYTVLVLVGFVMFYPMLWMIGASFKASNNEIYSTISFLPEAPSIQPYIDAWTATGNPYSLYLINSFKIVIPKVIGAVVSSVLTAYGFSRFDFPGKKAWFSILLATLFLPQVVLNIPQFLLFRSWGWTNSFLPLTVSAFFGAEPYFIFMLVQFMRSVSRELEEAAEIDGCNSFQRLLYIVVPMVKPTIVSVALFQFMWGFNDFQGPLIYIDSVKKYPTSLGLRLLTDAETGFEWNKVLALSVITLIPSLVIFFLAQDQFVDGIAAGGIKG